MSVVGYVIVGLLAGFVGRALAAGRPDPIRWLSLLVGVVGAVVAGLIGGVLYPTRLGTFFRLDHYSFRFLERQFFSVSTCFLRREADALVDQLLMRAPANSTKTVLASVRSPTKSTPPPRPAGSSSTSWRRLRKWNATSPSNEPKQASPPPAKRATYPAGNAS